MLLFEAVSQYRDVIHNKNERISMDEGNALFLTLVQLELMQVPKES
jgi:hypothetical protein